MLIQNFRLLIVYAVLFGCGIFCVQNVKASKREFRGAWIQCVNGQFQGRATADIQADLRRQLDVLKDCGINAIIFQVRPECDALYQSSIEPWSRYLTGRQGQAPSPFWDPLEWMIRECHKRGMELHAWINPYRAKTAGTKELAPNNVALQYPERIVKYADLFILNPALKENRDHVCRVVDDIVNRYDVDGIHIDDYFYPYPVAGTTFDDASDFVRNNNGFKNLGDWRRDNVNVFIKQLSEQIKSRKPWVKFGVSPFGIYRNKKNDPQIGSNTSGLQNYDDLYADVLLWVNNGWIDYNVPQLYWHIGNNVADYETLINWWNKYASNRPLFIGEDVERTVKYPDLSNPQLNQMPAKFALHSKLPNVNGTVLWYSRAVVDNVGNYRTALQQNYWKYPALQPLMSFIDDKAPKKVKGVKPLWTEDGYLLFWLTSKAEKWQDLTTKYVIYRFEKGEKINLNDPSKIIEITYNTWYKLPYDEGKVQYTYVVTALDRMSNESKGVKKKIKL